MTKQEIRFEIEENNRRIREASARGDKENFVLNEAIASLIDANKSLRLLCGETKHKFSGGNCVWCGAKEVSK